MVVVVVVVVVDVDVVVVVLELEGVVVGFIVVVVSFAVVVVVSSVVVVTAGGGVVGQMVVVFEVVVVRLAVVVSAVVVVVPSVEVVVSSVVVVVVVSSVVEVVDTSAGTELSGGSGRCPQAVSHTTHKHRHNIAAQIRLICILLFRRPFYLYTRKTERIGDTKIQIISARYKPTCRFHYNPSENAKKSAEYTKLRCPF